MAYTKPERFPCPFCECIAGRIPSAIVFENEHAAAFMAVNRRSKGAVLVSPKRHVEHVSQLTDIEAKAVMSILKKTAKAVCLTYQPEAFHIFCNAGIRAGQSVCHMHFQIQNRFDDEEYSFAPSIEIPWVAIDELRNNASLIRHAASDIAGFSKTFTTPDKQMPEFMPENYQALVRQNVVVADTENFFAVVPEYNRVKGSFVILPKFHVVNYLALSEAESHELILLVNKLASAIEQAYDPIGLSLWWETGQKADQHFDHLVVEMTPYHENIEYKYQDRSVLKAFSLAERQSSALEIINNLEL